MILSGAEETFKIKNGNHRLADDLFPETVGKEQLDTLERKIRPESQVIPGQINYEHIKTRQDGRYVLRRINLMLKHQDQKMDDLDAYDELLDVKAQVLAQKEKELNERQAKLDTKQYLGTQNLTPEEKVFYSSARDLFLNGKERKA